MSLRYVSRRLAQGVFGVFGILLMTFTLIHLAPGDAVDSLAGEGADPAYIAQLRSDLELDRPLPQQFLAYSGRVLRGDLGRSFAQGGRPVTSLIWQRLPATVLLMGTALVLSSIGGLLLGTLAARRPFGAFDLGITSGGLLGVAIPSFWLAQLVLLAVYPLGWFPLQGMTTARTEYTGLANVVDVAHHLVLPALVLAAGELALITRLTRTRLLEELGRDYVRTARGKGVGEGTIVRRHVLPNALLPIVTVIGSRVGGLVSGAVLVETVFGWPGLGRPVVSAADSRDRPLLMGMVLFVGVSVIIMSLITDLVYVLVDPRVEHG